MIYIVSGLPRSGTSMMMQMIANSGMEILTDEFRKADVSNPKGYYEYEPVKKLAQDNSWMEIAEGKCVKIIAQLLPHLKKGLNYRIIFMERPMEEVLVSQNVMLGKKDQPINPVIGEAFKKSIAQVMKMVEDNPQIQLLNIPYHEVIKNPEEVAKKVAVFIGKPDVYKAMAEAVSPELYRNRIN